jgi:hypothetical protein
LTAVIAEEGPDRAHFLIEQLIDLIAVLVDTFPMKQPLLI